MDYSDIMDEVKNDGLERPEKNRLWVQNSFLIPLDWLISDFFQKKQNVLGM